MSTTVAHTIPDSYLELVRQFPLTRIRQEDHLAQAQEFLGTRLR